jgi:hypothetical protein
VVSGVVLLVAVFVPLYFVLATRDADTGTSSTMVYWEVPPTDPSTTPASVPALASGITAEQVRQLVASYSGLSLDDIEVRDHKTFGDWAVAKVHPSLMAEAQVAGMAFQKEGGAWVLKVFDVHSWSLANSRAPAEVYDYFDCIWRRQ